MPHESCLVTIVTQCTKGVSCSAGGGGLPQQDDQDTATWLIGSSASKIEITWVANEFHRPVKLLFSIFSLAVPAVCHVFMRRTVGMQQRAKRRSFFATVYVDTSGVVRWHPSRWHPGISFLPDMAWVSSTFYGRPNSIHQINEPPKTAHGGWKVHRWNTLGAIGRGCLWKFATPELLQCASVRPSAGTPVPQLHWPVAAMWMDHPPLLPPP